MQSKSISQNLLYNSQISGIELKSLNTNLSEVGHGLYIESISNDRYADLRMCCDKPFWGHTHPLLVQYQFDNLNQFSKDDQYSIISKLEKKDYLHSYEFFTLENLCSELKNKKIHIILDEYSLLTTKVFDLLDQLSKTNDLIIEERNLNLFCNDSIFLTEHIESKKIMSFSFFDYSLITENLDVDNIKEANLVRGIVRYIDFLLLGESGKLQLDQNIMDEFFKECSIDIIREANYLKIDKNLLTTSEFLQEGILINDHNFIGNSLYLAVPVSCTKEELLDTLKRISKVLKR